MSNDFFDQVLDISRQVTARLVEQLEDARQKKLSGMQRDLDKLTEQRTQIEAQLANAQNQYLQLSQSIDGLHTEIQTVESYDVRSGIFNPAAPSITPPTEPKKKAKPAPVAAPPVVAPPDPTEPEVAAMPEEPEVAATAKPKPLKEYIHEVLSAHKKPMSVQALADEILAMGYVTKSKDFSNTVKSAIGEMKTKGQVKHVPNKGYALA